MDSSGVSTDASRKGWPEPSVPPALSPAPLAFDFGFPIVKEDDDEERLFTFTIDLPFN